MKDKSRKTQVINLIRFVIFFQWAWNLDWGEGFALLAVLFAFYYGKKWIDNKFGSINQKQAKQLKRIIREAIDESELIDKIK